MEWKKETLQSILKVNKEKLIFLFCSGLLLFVLSIPNEGPKETADSSNVFGMPPAGDLKAEAAGFSGGEGNLDEEAVKTAGGGKSRETEDYEKELEERIREILKNVDGVGEVDVMVVLKSSEEKVLRVDKNTSLSVTEENGGGSASSRVIRQQDESESTVLNGQNQGPIVEKELKPELSGIIISADGGGSAMVKAEISGAMEALFGLPPHKIKVLKRVKKGV